MSIVPFARVTLLAAAADRPAVLERLQAAGMLQPDALAAGAPAVVDARLDRAIGWLLSAPQKRRPDRRSPPVDSAALIEQALAARSRSEALAEDRAALARRIADVQPWGRFLFRPLDGHPELRLWFYRLPARDLARLDGLVWQVVHQAGGEHWVVIIAAEEPLLGLPRVHVGARTLDELESRLAEVDVALDDIAAERVALTRWLPQLQAERDRLADTATRAALSDALPSDGPLLQIDGWAPANRVQALAQAATDAGAAILTRAPLATELPPTLLRNRSALAPGAGLVGFFTTPDYRAWDPSGAVLLSFILFFAIIVSDAVYGLALLLLVGLLWRRLGAPSGRRQVRQLGLWLALATTVWGLLSGVYAGAPPPLPMLARLQLIPVGDLDAMLRLSIGVGLGHLVLANLIAARHLWPDRRALARMGWILLFVFAPTAALAPAWRVPALILAAIGFGAAVLFAGAADRRGLRPRLLDGAAAAARLVSALGDTLSYLRLFALALAGSALAAAFNMLARDAGGVPGIGLLLGMMVLILGHGLNLALSVASGVVHGLRLNYIEFFGWGLWGEGRPYRPFRQRGGEA